MIVFLNLCFQICNNTSSTASILIPSRLRTLNRNEQISIKCVFPFFPVWEVVEDKMITTIEFCINKSKYVHRTDLGEGKSIEIQRMCNVRVLSAMVKKEFKKIMELIIFEEAKEISVSRRDNLNVCINLQFHCLLKEQITRGRIKRQKEGMKKRKMNWEECKR